MPRRRGGLRSIAPRQDRAARSRRANVPPPTVLERCCLASGRSRLRSIPLQRQGEDRCPLPRLSAAVIDGGRIAVARCRAGNGRKDIGAPRSLPDQRARRIARPDSGTCAAPRRRAWRARDPGRRSSRLTRRAASTAARTMPVARRERSCLPRRCAGDRRLRSRLPGG